MATFVLVHGAWGGAHGFRKVRGPLWRAGHGRTRPRRCPAAAGRLIGHRDGGGHHEAGCGRARLERAQPGVQLQPTEPEQR